METGQCRYCGRDIINENGRWIDPNATGDDSVWRETCDSHDTFTAEHEPTQHYMFLKVEGGIADVTHNFDRTEIIEIAVDYDVADDSSDGPAYTADRIAEVQDALDKITDEDGRQWLIGALGSLTEIAEKHEKYAEEHKVPDVRTAARDLLAAGYDEIVASAIGREPTEFDELQQALDYRGSS